MNQMLKHLFAHKSNVENLGWDIQELEKATAILRLSALLHDIGHAPFSHAAEELFPVDEKGNQLEHEEYSYKIITETEIGENIEKHLGERSAEKVAEVAVNRAKDKNSTFLSELLAGDFGADRIDYLIRDSYHLGVQYGRFDVHRLLNTLLIRYNEEKLGPELYIEDGGIHSVESFILARYFMFLNVYFHKTRRIFDRHLVDFLGECLENQKYPLSIEQYIQWDDSRVLQCLKNKDGDLFADRLLKREHFRLAFETVDHPEVHELVQFDWLKGEVEQKFGKDIRIDEANKATYTFDQPELFVYHHKNKKYIPLSKSSTLVKHLKKIEKCRIYADKKKQNDVTEFCNTFWDEKSKRGREAH